MASGKESEYDVEVYELHSQVITVKASGRAEAVLKALSGEGTYSDNGTEYLELADSMGMSDPDLCKELRELQATLPERSFTVDTTEDCVAGVRSVTESSEPPLS